MFRQKWAEVVMRRLMSSASDFSTVPLSWFQVPVCDASPQVRGLRKKFKREEKRRFLPIRFLTLNLYLLASKILRPLRSMEIETLSPLFQALFWIFCRQREKPRFGRDASAGFTRLVQVTLDQPPRPWPSRYPL